MKMKIEIDTLEGFEFNKDLAGHFCCKTGVRKKIVIESKIECGEVKSLFTVFNKGEKVLSVSDLSIAVELFNKIK